MTRGDETYTAPVTILVQFDTRRVPVGVLDQDGRPLSYEGLCQMLDSCEEFENEVLAAGSDSELEADELDDPDRGMEETR